MVDRLSGAGRPRDCLVQGVRACSGIRAAAERRPVRSVARSCRRGARPRRGAGLAPVSPTQGRRCAWSGTRRRRGLPRYRCMPSCNVAKPTTRPSILHAVFPTCASRRCRRTTRTSFGAIFPSPRRDRDAPSVRPALRRSLRRALVVRPPGDDSARRSSSREPLPSGRAAALSRLGRLVHRKPVLFTRGCVPVSSTR